MAKSERYTADDADTDAGHLVELLDIIVEEGCGLDRDGMTPIQRATLMRLDALSWASRDIARRLSEGVYRAVKSA